MATSARTSTRNKPAAQKPEDAPKSEDTAIPDASDKAAPEQEPTLSEVSANRSEDPAESGDAPVDPFEALFQKAKVEEKETRRDSTRAETVPPVWIERVEKVFVERKRVTFPVTDMDQYKKLAELLRAAADKSEKNITAMCRAKYEGEGDDAVLVGLSLTCGSRRGQKKGKAKAETAKPETNASGSQESGAGENN